MVTSMGSLLLKVCFSKALQPHREALEADTALCSGLVGLLLRSLLKAAVAWSCRPTAGLQTLDGTRPASSPAHWRLLRCARRWSSTCSK